MAGDSLYVGDWGLRRTSIWSADGHLVRSIPAADVARGALPEGRDQGGRFYLELAAPAGTDGSGNRDSAAVVVADPGITHVDTLARLAPLDLAEVIGEAGRRFERRVFSGTDHWGVLADGSLWVARVYHNRVDVRSPDGRWTKGQSLPDRVLEVTRFDRELFFRKFPPELRATAERLPFAPVKPPFEAAITDPAGNIWLEKSRAPADSSRRYHVTDRQGRLLLQVGCPGPDISSPLATRQPWSPSGCRPAPASFSSDSPPTRRVPDWRSPRDQVSRTADRPRCGGRRRLLQGPKPGRRDPRGQATRRVRPAQQRGGARGWARRVRGYPEQAVPGRGPRGRQRGHARHPGGLHHRLRPARSLQVPRLGGASRRRHYRPGGLQRGPDHPLERAGKGPRRPPDPAGRRADPGARL